MKKISSYIAPFIGLTTLAICDYAVSRISINVMDSDYIIVISMYNFLALMVVWSFLSTTFRNPGFIPTGYSYDLTRMSRITYSLYQNIIKFQAANIKV